MSSAAAKKQRPKYLSLPAILFQIRLPLPGWVSILHRISGALLVFPFVAWGLYLLDLSLRSEQGFSHVREYLAMPVAKLGLLLCLWAACHHFDLYEDVADVLRQIHASGVRIGLISNTQRCLVSFERDFELEGLFSVALSSSAHGYMKPHRSIFEAALQGVGALASEAMMVGDSLAHDVAGARQVGMRPVLLHRAPGEPPAVDVPVIRTLAELLSLL